jgi:PAS domain S-box-containing protein
MKWVQISAQPARQENGDVIWDGVVIDFSDRKVAEKALMLKQKHLEALMNNIPHLAWIKDVQGRVIAVNEPFARAFGVSAEEVAGKTAYDIFPADLAQAYHNDDAEVLQSDQRKVLVEQSARADGTLGWFETTKTAFRDDELNIAGTVGIAADITDRKRMEIELAESEAKFRHLVEGGQDLIWAIDAQYHFTYLSPQFTTLFGWDVSEWIGRPSNEAVYPEDRGWLIEQQTLETVNFGMHNLEFRHCHRDRPYVWVRASATAITDSTGSVVGYQGVLSDISTLKQAELALKASERRYASLAAAAPVAIFRFDSPLNCVYVNERWSELSGRPMESALGHGWMEGLHPDDSEQRLAEWTEYYANSTPESQIIHGSEGRHLRPDGSTTWCYIQVAKEFDDDDNVVGYIGTLTDITDRKNIELALQESQAQFRRMTESVPGMIYRYVLQTNGRDELVYVSPQVQQIFELTPEAVLQDMSCLWARFHPEDIPMIQSAIQDSATSLQPFFVEGRLLLPNERVKWIQVSSQPDRQENGNIIWDGVVIDISDRKNAEKKLQELSERLELAIQSAQIGIWEFDFSSNRLLWDERMLAIHGISTESFHGTYEDWSSRVHPDDLLQAQPEISEEQAIYSAEFRIIRPDGTVRWIMSHSYKQRNLQGELVRAVGVNLDISDRKNTELALQDLSDRLEFALKGANIGIWEYQISDSRLIWDERMLSLYGISSEEFSGKYEDWLQRIHPDDLDWVQQAERQSYQGDKECRVEFRIIRPDGTIRFIDSFAFNQYNAQGEIQKTIGLNIDITDRKQAELQLQHINEELIKATRLKDEFLANMSHELRTPLNAILGMTEILEEQIFGDLNDRQLQSLHTIENSSNHLLELINDILDVAKIEAGQIKLSCQPSNVEALCQSSLVFIKQQAFSKKIQLESEIPANLPAINLDERRIRQVLINLLNNAVKFTPNGGKITLKASYIKVLGNKNNEIAKGGAYDTLEISIIDTGIGIAPDQFKRLFQPFVQVESALNRNYDGSGLGLALVKRLVELHGGEVRLTSELGVGSCFTIAIPISPFCELSAEPEPPLPSAFEATQPAIEGSPVILLAEDNEANINLFADYLSLKGYRLVIAHNGRMAIDLAQQTHPDVILMDIQMPEMDGLEAIQRIRQMPELADTPIIALTALAMAGDRDRCIEIGANDYLSKPVSLKQLVKKINGYLTEP